MRLKWSGQVVLKIFRAQRSVLFLRQPSCFHRVRREYVARQHLFSSSTVVATCVVVDVKGRHTQ